MPLGGHSREVRGFSSQRPSSSPRSPTSYRVNPTARSDGDGRRGNKGSIPLKRPFESGQYSFTLSFVFPNIQLTGSSGFSKCKEYGR